MKQSLFPWYNAFSLEDELACTLTTVKMLEFNNVPESGERSSSSSGENRGYRYKMALSKELFTTMVRSCPQVVRMSERFHFSNVHTFLEI